MKKAYDNSKAVQKFMVAVNVINDKLDILNEYMNDHMGVTPEEINWGSCRQRKPHPRKAERNH